ncbi:TonB-dependent receptor [Acidovorax sp. 106]|uniref:TonB-dependent siderophore receptor n=1 Tax=Acidovorax sp. 106 TaxID=2135637 RepID=UPI000F276DD9|nr:TonB-dependent receptor [Acidovorax sp. 106]RLJ38077.1 outer membrane receptor for ferric coprogen and ferric-rhodotorulic acid [Acidovorax sp. 106]
MQVSKFHASRPRTLVLALSGLALAMQVQVASAQPTRFDIAAQPLATALEQLARQAQLQLVFSPSLAQGRQAPAVQGTRDVQQALDALLQGSGLSGRVGNGTVTVARIAAETKTLSEVTVVSNQLGEVTEHSGSYTPGAIATATRLVLTPRETPQSVSVVTRQKMDDFQLTSIDQVMAHTPGVSTVTYDSERTEYYARGFAIQNFQYDGIPMMRDSSYSAGNTLSDMVMYDRVEVLKGATGLLTGSGTPGATINLVRKKPTRDFQGHVTASAGRWSQYRSELDLSGPVNESGSVRARGVAAYQDGKSHLDHYQRQTGVFYGVLEADLAPRTLLTLGMDAQNNSPEGSTWGGIPLLNAQGDFNRMPRDFNNGARWSHWDQYTRTGFATLEHTFDNGWVAKAQFNHQINGYNANLGAAASGFPDPATGTGVSMWAGQYIGRTTSNAGDVYASGPFELAGREHELVLGGSIANRRWKSKAWWEGNGYDLDVYDYYHWAGNVPAPAWNATPEDTDDETTRERGLYAAARWNLASDWKLITGGRWSRYTNREAGQRESGVLVPYLGTVVNLNDTYSLYASYTGIFTPQSLQDVQGRTLDPLRGKNYELGAKMALLDGRMNASVAVFKLEQDNFGVESGGKTPSGGTAYRAVQGMKTRGWELEVSGQITPAWQLQAGLSHSVSHNQGKRESTLTPSNQFSLYTSYKLSGSLAGLTLGGGTRWQDKTWGDISTPSGGTMQHTVKGYWLVDLMARYDFSKQLSASVTVNNVLDKKYYTIFSWYSTYTWGAPRSVNLSMTYRF